MNYSMFIIFLNTYCVLNYNIFRVSNFINSQMQYKTSQAMLCSFLIFYEIMALNETSFEL